MNRLEIRTKARKILGESTAAFWTDVQLNTWIDDAFDDIAKRTKCIKGNTTVTTVVSTPEYALLTNIADCQSIMEGYYYQDAAVWEKIDPTTREELNRDYPGWKSAAAGTPFLYYWDIEENILGVYPKPNATNAGAYFQVYYAKLHTDIGSDVAAVDVPLDLHKAAIEHIVATGLESRGLRDQAASHWSKYSGYVSAYQVLRDYDRYEDDDIIMIPGGNA